MLSFKSLQFLLLLMIFCTTAENKTPIPETKSTYIIHMDKSAKPKTFPNHIDWFETSLKSVSNSAEILYTYKHITHGFSTRLTSQEAEKLKKQQGILSITPEVIYKLHTTRTPQFLGLSQPSTLLPPSNQESQVIIGVLDTGIWPEQKSLHDNHLTNLGPIPSNWKGECEIGYNMNTSNCNKKLIGARFFSKGYEGVKGLAANKSARDEDGHGTHTLTTAAGSIVPNASLFGLASGTARGMAPHARVAAYKVCWNGVCHDSDIAAGIDKAIEDGVHIISMSLGSIDPVEEYYKDIMAIGGFSAMSHGIFVSTSAGNAGPGPDTLCNVAPWLTTVGAGTIDRDFPVYVILGNGKNFTGASLYNDKPLPDKLISVVYAGNVSNILNGEYCIHGSLIPSKVSGKIVICETGRISGPEKGFIVKNAGGIGMILVNNEGSGEGTLAQAHLLPAVNIGEKASNVLKNYVFSSSNPTATIVFGGTVLNVQPSPVVAIFSSRGPNSLTPKILKPDLIAPGVNILAGWSGAIGPSGIKEDKRRVSFNIDSGTSMSCPHVTGLAAILKAAHPEWSPAVIKSALMTTSYRNYRNGQTILDFATGEPATPFDFGAGHVDPLSALDPGLVYDVDVDDYLGFLCALNYKSSQIKVVAKRKFVCDSKKKYRLEDFNYPSFAVPLKTAPKTVKYSRVLTNVGTPGIYKASVSGISKGSVVKVLVEPEILEFKEVNEKKSYTVTFTCGSMPSRTNSFAYLEWTDGKHRVVSPIAISWT